VFACFVDFSKAFDNINYSKLFKQLVADGVELCFVRLFVFWSPNSRVLLDGRVLFLRNFYKQWNETGRCIISLFIYYTDMSVIY